MTSNNCLPTGEKLTDSDELRNILSSFEAQLTAVKNDYQLSLQKITKLNAEYNKKSEEYEIMEREYTSCKLQLQSHIKQNDQLTRMVESLVLFFLCSVIRNVAKNALYLIYKTHKYDFKYSKNQNQKVTITQKNNLICNNKEEISKENTGKLIEKLKQIKNNANQIIHLNKEEGLIHKTTFTIDTAFPSKEFQYLKDILLPTTTLSICDDYDSLEDLLAEVFTLTFNRPR